MRGADLAGAADLGVAASHQEIQIPQMTAQAGLLAWRDHRARRNGARISYQNNEILQNAADAEITARYRLITADSHDRMTARRDTGYLSHC